ncbi:DUF4917 family protein [Dialister hominis]|jgi:hypothetical protein|uniref:DUF4917 family protein n=1 Tax=Dialister hominis TaxID=2582419 RepID=UPI00265F26F7|nr:DUF4917 family protein [uncultured Dialister sp.]
MPDYSIYEFNELVTDQELGNATLILGNGASMAVSSSFSYTNLFGKACNDSILNQTSKNLFETLQTTDFELVMNKLRQAYIINEVLQLDTDNVALHTYDNIRQSLIKTIKEIHVQYADAIFQIDNIRKFLEKFKTVISLNYDLLIYWAIMASNDRKPYKMKDCFTNHIDGNLGFEYDIEKLREPYNGGPDPTLVFYPHGNLILASNENNDELKIRINNNTNLFDAIGEKWKQKYVPLFVSEGSSEQKLKAIRRSTYLNFVYENVLSHLEPTVIIYGWKLAEQEQHLIKKIFSNNKISNVYISMYLGSNPEPIDEQKRIASMLKRENRTMNIKFFDAASKNCWCNF